MPRKELAQEANHVNIGEKTYLVPVYRYFSSAHCTVVICLSPTDTNVIAWRHVPAVTFLFVGQHLWLQWQGREYLYKGNGWLLKTYQSDVKGISCQLLWLDASVLLFVCWKPAKYDGYKQNLDFGHRKADLRRIIVHSVLWKVAQYKEEECLASGALV